VAAGKNLYYADGQPALPATVETLNGNVTVTVVRSPHHHSCGACVRMGPGRSLYHTHDRNSDHQRRLSTLANQVNNTVLLNGKAKVVEANILASNGVVHAIDSVLIPSDVTFDNDKLVKGFKATDFLSRLVCDPFLPHQSSSTSGCPSFLC
jgi:hypothetical protein